MIYVEQKNYIYLEIINFFKYTVAFMQSNYKTEEKKNNRKRERETQIVKLQC